MYLGIKGSNRIALLSAAIFLVFGCVADDENTPNVDQNEARMDMGATAMDASQLLDMTPALSSTCEQEDDLYAAEPSPIEIGFDRSDLFLCAQTLDRFTLSGMPGNDVVIQLVSQPVENDLDLTLYDLLGEQLALSANETGEEQLIFSFTEQHPVIRIEISGYQETASMYRLSVTARCVSDRDCSGDARCDSATGQCINPEPLDCGFDEYEPNNREDEAKPIEELPFIAGAALCERDADWFEFNANQGDIINILATFPSGVDLDLKVLRADDGSLVTQAIDDASVNPERLVLAHLEAGAYLLGVTRFVDEGEADGDVDYEIQIVGQSGGCMTDVECLTDALPICQEGVCVPAPKDAGLGEICGTNPDCSDVADLCYEGAPGGQDNICTLYCESDNSCQALGANAYCQPISWQTGVCVPACSSDDQCGQFYVCAEGRCEVDAACRLDTDCEEGRVCRSARNGQRYCARPGLESLCGFDEDLEPNDRFGNAVELNYDQRIQDLRICNADDDYFVFVNPPSDMPYDARFEVSFRMGTDIDIYVYDELGNILGQATSADQTTEIVELTLLPPGNVYLRVDQFDSNLLQDTSYSILATLVPSGERCSTDTMTCESTSPNRSVCNEETGACYFIEGEGQVALGSRCDSNDDCQESADLCSPEGIQDASICTVFCERDGDCASVPDTSCTPIRRGVALCL